ncbi:OLC1v1016294C1 [Oldenlandia corymbosa var. corymbosa]|uniref:OLC1v1016294C1 n=1 Tax=Oldenlandia corymbosa var. corymbosa TaxID=529605 RepID=A0AAV1E5N2_OLDCO|nr:OLC1v1016294C1 [Oldenlandia corymbosa var. corymbosa]
MSSGVAGCTQIASKSVEGRMEAQVQLMKSQIDFLHDALAEVKEANRDLSQLLSNQQDKAMSIGNLFVLLNIEKESEKIGLAIGCFRSNALNWWKLVSNIYSHYWYRNLDDWHDLRSALRERYAGTNTFDEAKVKLFNCKQNGIEVDDSRTNPLKERGDDENHLAFHGDSPSKGNELVLHSRFGMPSLLCRPIKEERMDFDHLCDRELVQESYDQGDENVIDFGVQTKGDEDLMEISAEEYQVFKIESIATQLDREYDTLEKSIGNLFVLLNIEKESEKIGLAIGCFRSNALNWWKLVSNIYSHYWYRNLDDWHDLRSALRERYAGTNTFDEAKVKLFNCKQNGRSIQSYFEELEGLFLSSEVDENDYMSTDRFHYAWTSVSNNIQRPIKEERMDFDHLCDRELVQESYDQGDENVIDFGVQTKGDEDLMEISAEEYQVFKIESIATQLDRLQTILIVSSVFPIFWSQ